MKLESLFYVKDNNLFKIQDDTKISICDAKTFSYQDFIKNPLSNEYQKIELSWSSIELEPETYNEELLAQLRDNLKKLDDKNYFAVIVPIVDKPISSYEDAEYFIAALNHTARRIKDCVSLIGLEIPNEIFVQQAAADFMDTISKKHPNYIYFAKQTNEQETKTLLNDEYSIMTY